MMGGGQKKLKVAWASFPEMSDAVRTGYCNLLLWTNTTQISLLLN